MRSLSVLCVCVLRATAIRQPTSPHSKVEPKLLSNRTGLFCSTLFLLLLFLVHSIVGRSSSFLTRHKTPSLDVYLDCESVLVSQCSHPITVSVFSQTAKCAIHFFLSPTMSQVESPSVETIASPTAAAHSILPMSQPAAVPAKRSNFSISNLLASEEDKTDGAKNVGRLADDVKTMPSSSAVGSPFLNASALAHLAHLHTHGSTSSSSSSAPGWTDWLGTAGLGPDTHQSLWSR